MDVSEYPVRSAVDYPDRPLDPVSTLFRIFLAIPLLILLGTVSDGTWSWSSDHSTAVAGTGRLLFAGTLLMILFWQKYPRWWFDWNLDLQRFGNRVAVYRALMDDHYPATDAAQAVRLDYVYPDAAHDLNRWPPLVKWFLAIPHYLVLVVLNLMMVFAIIIAWVAAARCPRGLFDFVEGVLRWNNRVVGCAFTLVTDRYPPFRFSD